MNTRKYNTNPKILLEQGKAIMSSTDEARFHFKVFAVNMVLFGCPVSQISDMAGVSKVAVTGWVKTADERGFDALRPQRRYYRKVGRDTADIRNLIRIKTGLHRRLHRKEYFSLVNTRIRDAYYKKMESLNGKM